MNMKDAVNQLDAAVAIAAVAINTDTTTASAAIDLQGCEGALILIHSGVIAGTTGQNVYTPLITECDTSGGSFTAVADADLINTEASAVQDAITDSTVKKIGYKGTKRYIKVSIVSTAFTTAGGIAGAIVLRQVNDLPAA